VHLRVHIMLAPCCGAPNISRLVRRGVLTRLTRVLVVALAEHPSALVVFTACRKLLMPQSRLVWCLPHSAAEPAMTHGSHTTSGSSTATQGRGQVHRAGGAAGPGTMAASGSTKRAASQLATAPLDGARHHLTAAQVCGCYHHPLPAITPCL
jgi:hypothetical protein